MAADLQIDPNLLHDFRTRVKEVRQRHPGVWNASSRLVGHAHLQASVQRLREAIYASSQPVALQEALLAALRKGAIASLQELPAGALRQLTGLPATKALRALCVFFGVAGDEPGPVGALTPEIVEAFLRRHPNPFDLLLEDEAPSLLDLGAGDLSFALELAEQYMPLLAARGKRLLLHGIDRLEPGSRLGGLLQPDPERIERLQRGWSGLAFQLWSRQDMFDLERLTKLQPRYTIVTCHAPPTPTVAYEPSRISAAVIEAHLRETKGIFHKVRVEGEDALEVIHQDRALLFPPWKFDVKGPLALLQQVARRGRLGILAAVDNEVFWEILAQLPDDERFRPPDRIFTPRVLPEIFGEVHSRLSALAIGQSLILGDLAALRQDLPFRFRYIEIRRGATFTGQPAGRTARLFKDMKEEAPPWMLILVPEENKKA